MRKKVVFKNVERAYRSRSGKNHWSWRSKKPIRYASLHQWIYKIAGKADHCEACGATEIPI